MEVLLLSVGVNAVVIVISGAVHIGIDKFNRSKIKKMMKNIVEEMKEHTKEIENKFPPIDKPPEPYDLQTPSENGYVKPDRNDKHYM